MDQLPPELIYNIIIFMNYDALMNYARTNRKYREIVLTHIDIISANARSVIEFPEHITDNDITDLIHYLSGTNDDTRDIHMTKVEVAFYHYKSYTWTYKKGIRSYITQIEVYNYDGLIHNKLTQFMTNQALHRYDGPAQIDHTKYDSSMMWYINGLYTGRRTSIMRTYDYVQTDTTMHARLHSIDDQPGIEYIDNKGNARMIYFENDVIHREAGPAIIELYPNGNHSLLRWQPLPENNEPYELRFYENGNIKSASHIPVKPDEAYEVKFYSNGNRRLEIFNDKLLHCDITHAARDVLYEKRYEKSRDEYGLGVLGEYDENNVRFIEYNDDGSIRRHVYNARHKYLVFPWNTVERDDLSEFDMKNSNIITYYDGKISEEQWYNKGMLHRLNEPASIKYHPNGKIKEEKWYDEGMLHRNGTPAITTYFPDGKIKSEAWYDKGKRHRTKGPSYIQYSEETGEPIKTHYKVQDNVHKNHKKKPRK